MRELKEDFSRKRIIFEVANWDENDYGDLKRNLVELVHKNFDDVCIKEETEIQYME